MQVAKHHISVPLIIISNIGINFTKLNDFDLKLTSCKADDGIKHPLNMFSSE